VRSLLESAITALPEDLAARPHPLATSNVYPPSVTGRISIDVIRAIDNDTIDNKTFAITIISLRGLRRSKGGGIITALLYLRSRIRNAG